MRAAALIISAVGFPALAGPQATIELLPDAQVPPGTVVLGQVARLHASDLDVMRKLVHLPIGRAPAPGDVSMLRRDVVAQWIHRRAGMAPVAVVWSGPEEGRVIGVAAQLRGDEIARAALEAARAQLVVSGRTGDVQARLVPRDVPLPGGEVRLEVRGLDQASWPRRLVVWVDVWAGGWFVRTVPVGLETVGGPADAADEPSGMPLGAGEVSAAPMRVARDALAVARGDWALLRSSDGGINLEMRVEVLQDGRPGQKVRVRQQGAAGPVLARVVGKGLLEIAP